jgi:hypothetical protein
VLLIVTSLYDHAPLSCRESWPDITNLDEEVEFGGTLRARRRRIKSSFRQRDTSEGGGPALDVLKYLQEEVLTLHNHAMDLALGKVIDLVRCRSLRRRCVVKYWVCMCLWTLNRHAGRIMCPLQVAGAPCTSCAQWYQSCHDAHKGCPSLFVPLLFSVSKSSCQCSQLPVHPGGLCD